MFGRSFDFTVGVERYHLLLASWRPLDSLWLSEPSFTARSILGGDPPGLRDWLERRFPHHDWNERDCLRTLLDAKMRSTWPDLVLYRRKRALSSNNVIGHEDVEELEPSEITAQFRLRLLDDNGEPVPNARYEVELSDGSSRSGQLDGDGAATLRGVPPGRAKVRWPDLHPDDWAYR